MRTQLKFYKKNERWYADVKGHTEEDNEMILGSDSLLDILCDGNDTVVLDISDKFVEGYKLKFSITNHDEDGAEYLIAGPLADAMNEIGFTIWICNVTHTVFGEHPEIIYLVNIAV